MNSFAWTRTADAHSGSFAEKLDVSSFVSGDRKLVVTQDAGTCAVSATPGHTYAVSAWYKSPSDPNPSGSQPSMFAYYRNSAGTWTFWAQSPKLPSSSTWRQGTWNTPALPAGATHVSVGLGLTTMGTVTMDDLVLADNAPPPDTTPPTSEISCNGDTDEGGCRSGFYSDAVQVSLEASDDEGGSGIASIRYTTNGSDPTQTNGMTYNGAFSVASPGATTVKWRAYDKAGNAEAIRTETIRIDPTAPVSSITCNTGACVDGFYAGAVSVELSATDAGGSGVLDIRYTTDGSDPTTTDGKSYIGAFSVSTSTTVKFRAYDNAGNAEPIETRSIQIDSVAPTATISCNGAQCSDQTYTTAVDVGLDATDGIDGSGVSAIRYTTDGSDPTATNGTVYVSPFTFQLDTTTTVKYRAFDNAGNAGPINSQVIRVDTSAPPSLSLDSPSDGSTVSGNVQLSASVSDSTITTVDFLVDGQSVGTASATPFTLEWDSSSVEDGSHSIAVRGLDADGNELATDSVAVTVDNAAPPDTTAPTTTISCNDAPCSPGTYGTAVSVTLSATDNAGGSGVHEIRYTIDGTNPTSSTGVVYSGSFTVTGNTTVKYRAFDHAGNAEAVQTQDIRTDTIAPSSSIACAGTACSSSYYSSAVPITLAASDAGGSGVAELRYTTDGSDPTTSNGAVYTASFSLTSTTTVKYRAFDNAGNAEPINSALIRVDTTAPSTAIACAGGSCAGPYKPGVSVSLTAADGDSGVASIRYTTNGSDPTPTTGTVYTAPFTLAATTTVKYRAFDNVGNAEPVATKQIVIDGTAPTVSLTSPNAGDLVAGTTPLTATATDNIGIDHVDFLVDGQQVGSASSSPYSFNWNSASVTDGTHAVTARAVDTAGNTKTSGSVSVVVTNNNLVQNASLETASGSTPTCWQLGGYGTNSFTWTRSSDAHTGAFGEVLTITSLTNGDRKLISAQDAGACAPVGTPGRSYTVTAWYKSTDGAVIFAYYRNSAGSWVYWANSPKAPSATAWTRRTWTTPALPAGATAISVGVGLLNTGTVTMDDFGLFATG
jgi:hypothetical protein